MDVLRTPDARFNEQPAIPFEPHLMGSPATRGGIGRRSQSSGRSCTS